MSALPPNPSLTHLKNQAKALLKGLKAGEPQAFKRLREALPHYQSRPDGQLRSTTLVDAQLVVAREYGYPGWVALREAVRTSQPEPAERAAHLLEAVSQNDAETVGALLAQDPTLANSQGPFPSFSSKGEFSVLHIAALKGNAEIVELLLDHGADIDAVAEGHWTALAYAVQHRNPAIAERLIARGGAVDIFAAVNMDDRERVAALLDADPALVHRNGGDNDTRPIDLVRSVEMARLLVARGAEAGAVDLARFADDPERAAFFIEHGAEVDLESAIRLDDIARATSLLAVDPGAEARDTLALARSVEMAELLLKHGADPNARTGGIHEQTPLGSALGYPVGTFRRDLAECLIAHGAEVDIVSAAALGDIDQVRAFLAQDAALANTRSFGGCTALHTATSAAIVKLLLDHGADPNAKVNFSNGGFTVLQIKLWQKDLALVKLLLDHGADPRGQDTMRGWTNTQWAERWHKWEEARELLAGYENAA